ncbi:hypothetical protein CFC21_041273, partial [Triticum aestivum]
QQAASRITNKLID